jgi:hypothetical protein
MKNSPLLSKEKINRGGLGRQGHNPPRTTKSGYEKMKIVNPADSP